MCKSALHTFCGELGESSSRPTEDQPQCAESHRGALLDKGCVVPLRPSASVAHHKQKHHLYPWGWAGYGGYSYFPTYPYWGSYSDGTPYWNGYYASPSYWGYGAYFGFKEIKKAETGSTQTLFMDQYKQCANKISTFCHKDTKTAKECADLIEAHYEELIKEGCPTKEVAAKCRGELNSMCGQVEKNSLPSDSQLQCVEKHRFDLENMGCRLPAPNQNEFKINEAATPPPASKDNKSVHHQHKGASTTSSKQWPLQSYYTLGNYGYTGWPSLDYYGYSW